MANDGIDSFVSLDLETTGLNVDTDQIIDVGATRFDRSGAFENYSTFVDPGRGIPREVRELTGIADADLRGAPRFTEVRDALREFIGDRAIVGQNIAFDLAFLRAEQIIPSGPSLDTWEMASVLLPTATRLNLASLAAAVGVHMPVAHRALADAEATRDIFLALIAKLEALPRSLLLELRVFAVRAGWAFSTLIDDALMGRDGVAPALDEAAAYAILSALPLPPVRLLLPPLVPRDPILPTLPEEIEALFTGAATRTDLLPSYERRDGQETMSQAVARHLDHGGVLAVEAGTGTGKSLAYLLPTLLHALRNDDRVVISTHTLNLQDQLAHKDLPVASALVEELAGVEPGALRTTVLKGRGNYLCLERWSAVRMDPSPRTEAEARLFGRVAAWLPMTETGDLAELYMTSQERPAWSELSAEGTDCLQRRCAYVREGTCFLLRARARAASAHAVVVNHALLLANAARADQVLPPFRHLVIDEAHRLEDVATQHYGAAFSARDVRDLIDKLGQTDRHGEPGFVRRLQGIGQGTALALSPLAGLAPIADRLEIAVVAAREHVRPLADALRVFADEHIEENGPRREISLTAARRAQPAWEEAAEAAMQLDMALQIVTERVTQVRDAAAALPEGTSDLAEVIRLEAAQAVEALSTARETLRRTALQPKRDDIAWLAVGEGDQRLHLAPLDVSDRLEQDLYRDRASILLTSATLSAAGSFDFTLDRLGLREADTLEVPSPFDYRRAVLALMVDDLPEPGMPGYERALHETLADAARAAGGRTLALFTSHASLRAAANALRDLLARDDIVVLGQGIDGSPGRLLRLLVERPRTILLGTAAFWEGVDVPGDALSQILVTRLPFPVPNDPVYAGRAEQFDDPFAEFAVPQSVLRFRQGFGRLIRGTTDRGVFAVLDSRIVRRSYGEVFVDALPDCEVRNLRADDVPRAVQDWLA